MLAFAPSLPGDPLEKLWGKSMAEEIGGLAAPGVPNRPGGSQETSPGGTNGWEALYGQSLGENIGGW